MEFHRLRKSIYEELNKLDLRILDKATVEELDEFSGVLKGYSDSIIRLVREKNKLKRAAHPFIRRSGSE